MKDKKLLVFNLVLYFSVFLSSLYRPFDPDLGWQLKYGEYFFTHHEVLRTNIFSSLMPNYSWVNHSWGADVILYTIFQHFGFFGLTIAGALTVTLTFYFIAKAARLSIIHKLILFPALLFLESALNFGSFRPQSLSLLLFSILIYLLCEYGYGTRKKIYFVIPLLLVWANLHGQFILGLSVFLLWIVLLFITRIFRTHKDEEQRQWRELVLLVGVFGLAALSVLINPFGVGVYTEALHHFSNPNLQYIIEWHPWPVGSFDWWSLLSVGGLVAWSGYYLKSAKEHEMKEFKKILPVLGITLALFGLSLTARRYVWPFYYSSIPFLALLLRAYLPEFKKNLNGIVTTGLSLMVIIVFFTKSPFDQYIAMSWDTYCQERLCSPKAAEFLIEHQLHTNPRLLTQYDLGGWLIWNYPQIKPTIDGRMTLWVDDKGESAFQDYILLENNIKDIDQSKYDIAFVSIRKPITAHLARLSMQGKWELVYGDKNVGIFVRKTGFIRVQ